LWGFKTRVPLQIRGSSRRELSFDTFKVRLEQDYPFAVLEGSMANRSVLVGAEDFWLESEALLEEVERRLEIPIGQRGVDVYGS
jgi:hypothetical protein